MNLRDQVKAKYGTVVGFMLDRLSEVLCEDADDYSIGRRDRGAKNAMQIAMIKESIISKEGPIATERIVPATGMDSTLLSCFIESYHDVDEAVKAVLGESPEIFLDSESSSMFVHSTKKSSPMVIAALQSKFPGVSWKSVTDSVELSPVTVMCNWPEAKNWARMRWAEVEA